MKKTGVIKKCIITFVMAIVVLVGLTLTSRQEAKAGDIPKLSVDGTWSQTFTKKYRVDDLCTFTIPADGTLTCAVWSQMTNEQRIVMCDENLKGLGYFDISASKVGSASFILSAGTHYIRVCDSRFGEGDYKIRLSFVPFEVNDQNAGTFASPQTISLGSPVNGALTLTDREDWFRIAVPKSGSYTLSMMYLAELDGSAYGNKSLINIGAYLYNGDLSKKIVESVSTGRLLTVKWYTNFGHEGVNF